MKPYDAQLKAMRSYFGSDYPYVIVLKGHLDYDWMTANLKPTYTYTVDNDMGHDYQQTIIGYGTYGVHNRPDEYLHLFHDKNHIDQIVAAFPDKVVTTDPFGPDICPDCGKTEPHPQPKIQPSLTGWRKSVAKFIGAI